MISRAFTAVALLLGAASAQAHVKVESIKPADKSRVSAPATIELGFSEPAWLSELTLQREREPVRKLQVSPDHTVLASVKLPALAAGTYVVTYRVESDDGHATTGKFSFTVDPAAPAAGAGKATAPASQHDHAAHGGMPHGSGKDGHP